MSKIVLAFDSFKGSVGSAEITDHLIRSIRREWPACQVCGFPIADGGEGTAEMIAYHFPVRRMLCQVHGPLMQRMAASYAVTPGGTVVLETAAASGYALVEEEYRNPMETTTLGTGELIQDALRRGYRKFVLGLGGSATNDAGIGILHALGARFYDAAGNELCPVGRSLGEIVRMDVSRLSPELEQASFTLACDVQNPLYGDHGAAFVYAPQKGATSEQVLLLDAGLRTYAAFLERETGCQVADILGAGAAGGVGGGLLPFLKAELKSGIDILLDLVHFDEALQDADLVLTGEGKIDGQTGMGKALNGVLKRAQARRIPVVGLGGSIESAEVLHDLGFTALFPIHPRIIALEAAMQKEVALQHLNQAVLQVLRLWFANKR